MKTPVAAIATLLAGLVGCSGADEDHGNSPGVVAAADATPTDEPASPGCPDVDAGTVALAASPFAACVGRFSGTTYAKAAPDNRGGIGSEWLHRTAEGCLVGQKIVLHADGTAALIAGGPIGSWSGDELYFETDIGDRINEYARTEATPSQ